MDGRYKIGFVSTRIAGTDGVSLETKKWAAVLERAFCRCFYMAGELDTPSDVSFLTAEAHFMHPEIAAIREMSFLRTVRPPELTSRIHAMKDLLKKRIYEFLNAFTPDLLIAENVFSIPLNIPLGMALTEVLAETSVPTIAHHHDFFWERQRFLANCVWDYLNMAFPPNLESLRHVVINSSQAHQLGLRKGVSCMQIPNVMEFENPPQDPDDYASDVRDAFGLDADGLLILQPTRVIQRKGIEHAVELVSRLGRKAKLVISHSGKDEGTEYKSRIRRYSEIMGVDTVFVDDSVSHTRGRTSDGRKIYTLCDVYPHADLITYPSTFEGFGNAFLEAIYFRKPIVVNAYAVYHIDIRPKGFRLVELDGYVTDAAVEQVRHLLDSPDLRAEMAEHNYAMARQHYSFAVLKRKLNDLICDCLGIAGECLYLWNDD